MIVIPNQLKDFRFIKTFRKHPSEAGWPIDPVRHKKQPDGSYLDQVRNTVYRSKGQLYKDSMRSYNYDEMSKHLEEQEEHSTNTLTYGVLGGYNGLVIVDVDDKRIAQKLKNLWPFSETFCTLSGGKRLPHFYFKCEDYCPVIRFDSSSNKRIMDIQGTSTYVIGPGSRIRSNNVTKKYTVENEADVLEIKFSELIRIIEEALGDAHKIQKKEKHLYTDKYFNIDPITTHIFNKISCTQILDEAGIDVSNNPGDTPFAQSIGKRCLHRTEYLWYDHHIQDGGNVIQLYARLHKIDSIKAKYDLAERAGVTEEIFKSALQYFIKNQQHEMTELLAIKWLGTMPTHTIRADKSSTPEIYIYKDGIYIPNGMSYIQEFLDNILGKWYTTTLAKKVIDKIVVRSLINPEEFFQEADTSLLPVENGVLDIFQRKLYEFTPNLHFFNKLPVSYKPDKTCENTLQHFQKVLNGELDIKVMQELYGYLLYRAYPFEKALMFYGTGGNGKSKTIEQMKALIGDDNCVNLSLQQLQNEKFMRGLLHQKLANLADDIGHARLEETQIFKELTGGSTITADRKFLSSISFKSYAKMVFSANKVPDTVDDTDAFWRRWILVGFTKKFVSAPEYELLREHGELKDCHCVADPEIIELLTTDDELSGVLNWALEGLNRLIEQKGFSQADSYREVRRLWRRNVSSAVAFFQDCIVRTFYPDDYEIQENLYNAYVKYCVENRFKAETERVFTKYLQEENLVKHRKRVAHGNEWRWEGIRLEV